MTTREQERARGRERFVRLSRSALGVGAVG